MEPFRLPNEDEITVAYDQDKVAIIVLFHATFQKLAERMQILEDRVAKNNHNSGKPLSSEGLKAKPTKCGNRKPNGKKSDGQLVHEGQTRKENAHLGRVRVH